MNISLIQLPTVRLLLHGYDRKPIQLRQDYTAIIPASLLRVASVIEQNLITGTDSLDARVKLLDIRIENPKRIQTYKTINWEGYQIEAQRLGGDFSLADETIMESD